MKSNRAVLEAELENYEERLKSVSSYAAELESYDRQIG